MAIDEGTSVTTHLLTLLNVSATKAGKRKWTYEEPKPTERLNKRRVVNFSAEPDENDAPSQGKPANEDTSNLPEVVEAPQDNEEHEEEPNAEGNFGGLYRIPH